MIISLSLLRPHQTTHIYSWNSVCLFPLTFLMPCEREKAHLKISSAPQMTSQFTIISSDHSFFAGRCFCVLRCIFLCPWTLFFSNIGNVMLCKMIWFCLNAFCFKNRTILAQFSAKRKIAIFRPADDTLFCFLNSLLNLNFKVIASPGVLESTTKN